MGFLWDSEYGSAGSENFMTLYFKLYITSLLLNIVVVDKVKVCSWCCIFLFFCFTLPWAWYLVDRFILKSEIEEKRSQLDKANYEAKGQYKNYCFRVLAPVLAGVSNKEYTIVMSPAWKMLFTIIMTHNKNLSSSHITCALWLEEYLHKCKSTYHWANKQLRRENLFLSFSCKWVLCILAKFCRSHLKNYSTYLPQILLRACQRCELHKHPGDFC